MEIAFEGANSEPAALTGLCLEAAHGRLLMAMSHELMNQQNGIQVNAQLIKALAAKDSTSSQDIVGACDRLLTESRRSVEMFSQLRDLGKAMGPSESDQQFPAASVLPSLLNSVAGRKASRVELSCDGEQRLLAATAVALGAFVLSLLSLATGQIVLRVGKDYVAVSWSCESAPQADDLVRQFQTPSLRNPLFAALPLLLSTRSVSPAVEATELAAELRFPIDTLADS